MYKLCLITFLTLSISACVSVTNKHSTQQYTEKNIGLSFQYPPTWKIVDREAFINDNHFTLSRAFKNDSIARNYFMVIDIIPLKKNCEDRHIERRIRYSSALDLGTKIIIKNNDKPLPNNVGIRNYSQTAELNHSTSKAFYYNYCHKKLLVEIGLSEPHESIMNEFNFILNSLIIENHTGNDL